MALNALPRGWVLDAGVLGTDIDEDTTLFLTGNRALRFIATGTTTRVLSGPFPVGVDVSTDDAVRRKIGVTICFYLDGFTGPSVPGTFGLYWYDSNGDWLSTSSGSLYSAFTGMVWSTNGRMFDVPTGAQTARMFIEFTGVATDVVVDYMLPYMVPPIADADVTQDPLQPIVALGTFYNLYFNTPPATGVNGSNAIIDERTPNGSLVVQETGVYTMTIEVELDDFTASDAFMLRLSSATRANFSEIFTFAIALASLTLPAGVPHLQFTTQMPIIAGDTIRAQIAQLASGGVFREVVDGKFYAVKDV